MAAQFQPLAQSFQALLLQLYRRWYGLPRKRTQAWLETERLALAQRLRQEASVDALQAFVEQAAKRPGVVEAAADELAAVETSLRNSFLARLNPEEIEALVALLTVEEPVADSFGRWVYLSGRAAETLNVVRKRLDEKALERLPEAIRSEIETTFSALDVALAEIGPADDPPFSKRSGPRRQAMLQALESLEQAPAVLRIAWRALLAGKAQMEPKTLGGDEFMAADMSFALPIAAPSLALADAAPGAPEERRFHTDVVFPERVVAGIETPLTVRLALDEAEASRLNEIVDVQFEDPAEPELIDVIVDAPGFSERFDLWNRTMVVYSDRDSEPVTFLLTAEVTGRTAQDPSPTRLVKVTFYHAGKHIGQGSFMVAVGYAGSASSRNVAPETGDTTVELRLVDLPPPADLELRVTHDVAGQALHFMLHSTKAAVGYHWRPMGSVPLLDGKPQVYFGRQLEQLNDWSSIAHDDLYKGEEADFTRKMANMGEELFDMLFSPQLRDAYWRDIRSKQQAGVIQSLLITSDEPWIPWELVKPYDYDEITDEEQEDDFLAHTFQISRWLTGYGPYERVTVDAAEIIAPNVGLFHASGEADYLKTLSQRGVAVGEALQTKAAVIEVLQAGNARLLHVASHADFDPEHPDASPIALADEDLLPGDLDRHVIRRWRTAKPLIFLNACETGRIEYELTGLGGWAEKFIRDVRATAFLGTLWKVNDALAAEFARVFYDELLAGQTLGAACHTARQHIRELAPANPTWLAYTLYGDPNTRVAWGADLYDHPNDRQ